MKKILFIIAMLLNVVLITSCDINGGTKKVKLDSKLIVKNTEWDNRGCNGDKWGNVRYM